MKRENKRMHFLALLAFANTGGMVQFAGPGGNFPKLDGNGGGNNGNQQNGRQNSPMNGGNGNVPNNMDRSTQMRNSNTQNGFDPNQSKMVPGKQTQSRQDQNDPNFQQQNDAEGSSPLAKFKDLFQTSDSANSNENNPGGQGIKQGGENNVNNDPLSVGQKDFQNFASKLNFSNAFSPEDMSAIQTGGEGATKALQSILNKFGQQLFTHTMTSSTALAKKGYEYRENSMDGRVRETNRLQQSSNHLMKRNAVFKDPAVAPVIEVLNQQMANKNPNASYEELSDMTYEYLQQAFGPLFQSQQNAESQQEENGQTNFVDFFSTKNPGER